MQLFLYIDAIRNDGHLREDLAKRSPIQLVNLTAVTPLITIIFALRDLRPTSHTTHRGEHDFGAETGEICCNLEGDGWLRIMVPEQHCTMLADFRSRFHAYTAAALEAVVFQYWQDVSLVVSLSSCHPFLPY